MKTGRDLYDYLKETGTGAEKLNVLAAFLRQKPDAKGDEAVAHLIDEKVNRGTIRKAGQYIYGPEWDYTVPGTSVTDEMANLRNELAEVRGQLKTKEIENTRLIREARELRERLEEMGQKVMPARIRDSEDAPDEPDQPPAAPPAKSQPQQGQPTGKGLPGGGGKQQPALAGAK